MMTSESALCEEAAPQCSLPRKRLCWRVLLISTDSQLHASIGYTLNNATIINRSIEFLHANSSAEAKTILCATPDIAVVILDVDMESDQAALRLVHCIRHDLQYSDVRIILHTAQTDYKPNEIIIRDHEINDYRVKAELTSTNLYITMTSAIRSFSQICTIKANHMSLEKIVQANSDLLATRDVYEFANQAIEHAGRLLDIVPDAIVGYRNDATDGEIHVKAASGCYSSYVCQTLDFTDHGEISDRIGQALVARTHKVGRGYVVLYIGSNLGAELVAYFRLDKTVAAGLRQMLEILCTNISVFLDNITLLERLRNQAYFDPLLCLPNRTRFVERIQEAYTSERMRQTTLAVIDIDRFSEANDAYGQQYGDRLLRAIAHRLSTEMPPDVVVASVAGDTFGLLGDDDIVCPRILQNLFRADFLVDGNSHPVSATLGLVRLPEIDSVSYAMQDVGIALKRAKADNQSHYCYYTRNMGGEVRTRVRMMQELRSALGAGSLFLLYQPQINLQTKQPVGAEALLRWRTGDGQIVPPDQFIPLAEASGLIVSIGDWVLQNACEELAALHKEGYTGFRMAINISVVQFRHVDFLGLLRRTIESTGVDPHFVELEITESVAMLEPDRIVAMLKQIKNIGCTIAIDDFGTGFSSLAYLQRLPVDRLKIDREFVSRLAYDGESKNIADMIINLGRNFGMGIIAEGVEERAQAEYLASVGCHEAQGFLFGRPNDVGTLRKWWENCAGVLIDNELDVRGSA